jgi:hypothetical protein
MTGKPKRVRCAVYTLVSTEYGLDQEFNSSMPTMKPQKPISAARPTTARLWFAPYRQSMHTACRNMSARRVH